MNVYFDNAATTKNEPGCIGRYDPMSGKRICKRIKSSYSGTEVQGSTGESKRGDRSLYRSTAE